MGSNSRKEQDEFVPSGFFALRTPLLPFDEFLDWSEGLEAEAALDDAALAADRVRLRARLKALLQRPVVRDALFIASPDLDESLETWLRDPDSERGGRVERAIIRYFARMAGRPTPFGLFAGSSIGAIGDQTRLVIGGRNEYRRRSRLDMDCLFALAEAIGRDPVLRQGFTVRPNSSLYPAAGRVHYVEARLDGKNRTHHLVGVEDSGDLRATLDRAAGGLAAESLAAALVNEEVSRAQAEEYVQELIDSQILRPDLDLFVTGSEPTEALASKLRGATATAAIGDRLENVRKELAAIDEAGPGADPARYRSLAGQLEGLPAPVELSRLFQVDMIKASPEALLGGAVLDEIVRGVETLRRLAPKKTDDLSRFRQAFEGRYEKREVPLVEVLDEEIGIGFSLSMGVDAAGGPLLKGLELAGEEQEADLVAWGKRESFLLRKLTEAAARGAHELLLEPGDIERIGSAESPPLPRSFSAMVSVAAASDEALSRGDFRLLWMGSDGPSGARLLGRFCPADPDLRGFVERHLRAEEALDPAAVFAEIVHLPEGRLGNILFRPVLREYEIPYLGQSAVDSDRQIPITDLLVSVSGGEVILRSKRLGRRVIPRLTTAHNFRRQGLGLYRFLCALQEQGTACPLGWDWGALWSASFLPRVVCGRLVLSPAQWNLNKEELERLSATRGTERFRTVQAWRAERRLPRLVILADGDNKLPIDLANVLSVETFVHLIQEREEARLIEMFPGPDELCARGPEGRFLHEIIVPFVRTSAAGVGARANTSKSAEPSSLAPALRFSPPGSEWLYAKLYLGASTADRALLEIVAPLVGEALASGAADRWFFIRYGDPDWHLRVRFHGEPARLLGEILPALHAAAAPGLGDGWLWKMQLDTYEREVERYGGPEAIELAEQFFQADSEATLEILEMLEVGDEGADERWRLAVVGIDTLLGDLGFDLEGKRALLRRVRGEFARELSLVGSVKQGLGARFRKESRSLQLLLEPLNDDESPLSPGIAVLRRRSDRLAPVFGELKALEQAGRLSRPLTSIAPSYVHMHVNRQLRSAHGPQELVLYDFLARLYESQAARAGRDRGRPNRERA